MALPEIIAFRGKLVTIRIDLILKSVWPNGKCSSSAPGNNLLLGTCVLGDFSSFQADDLPLRSRIHELLF